MFCCGTNNLGKRQPQPCSGDREEGKQRQISKENVDENNPQVTAVVKRIFSDCELNCGKVK